MQELTVLSPVSSVGFDAELVEEMFDLPTKITRGFERSFARKTRAKVTKQKGVNPREANLFSSMLLGQETSSAN